jgi:hypothetical protein
MSIRGIMDNVILFKEAVKLRIADNPLSIRRNPAMPIAEKIVAKLNAGKIERIINGKPNSYVIITHDMVIRIPLDKLTGSRYRLNKIMLKKLAATNIADCVPRFMGEGKIDNYIYFCEERLLGNAIDVPLRRMDEMVLKAANFITDFHKGTAKEIILDEGNFIKLFSRLFNSLSIHLGEAYKKKLVGIERELKNSILGKPFITVWQHGDYKIENVLFNTSNWKIEGIIDWDLARMSGLPLLDIFYLFLYKDNLETRKGMAKIFVKRFLKSDFYSIEETAIANYIKTFRILESFIKPLLVMFWLQHVTERYANRLTICDTNNKQWFSENINAVIDAIKGWIWLE